jgi:hypothetical protein
MPGSRRGVVLFQSDREPGTYYLTVAVQAGVFGTGPEVSLRRMILGFLARDTCPYPALFTGVSDRHY